MKSELQQLLINNVDQLAGRSYLMEKKKIDKLEIRDPDIYWKIIAVACSVFVFGLTIALTKILSLELSDTPITLMGYSIVFIFVITYLKAQDDKTAKYNLKRKYAHLLSLKDEVEKHNKIIEDIDILDQLQSVGNPVTLQSREQVISALSMNKDSLVRAIKTERILRENPRFRPEEFNVDLTALRALQISEQAGEYGQLLSEALNIAVNVQKEMNQLVERR